MSALTRQNGQARCRVALKSDTGRVEREFLPLNLISGWLWGAAFSFSSGNLINRSKQTGVLPERTKQTPGSPQAMRISVTTRASLGRSRRK